MSDWILVTGAGGFLGGHLVRDLLEEGSKVRAVDKKPANEWYQRFDDAENFELDLSLPENCYAAPKGSGRSTTLPPTWGAWGSSSSTRRSACSRS